MQTELNNFKGCHFIEMCENKYIVIQLHGTFKHKMVLMHSNVLLFMRHHFI